MVFASLTCLAHGRWVGSLCFSWGFPGPSGYPICHQVHGKYINMLMSRWGLLGSGLGKWQLQTVGVCSCCWPCILGLHCREASEPSWLFSLLHRLVYCYLGATISMVAVIARLSEDGVELLDIIGGQTSTLESCTCLHPIDLLTKLRLPLRGRRLSFGLSWNVKTRIRSSARAAHAKPSPKTLVWLIIDRAALFAWGQSHYRWQCSV